MKRTSGCRSWLAAIAAALTTLVVMLPFAAAASAAPPDARPAKVTCDGQPAATSTVGGSRLAECEVVAPQGVGELPQVRAQAWLVADLDSGEVIAARDAHAGYPAADTLKLLTINVLLQTLPDPNRVIVGTDDDPAQPGTLVGIGEGGRYRTGQLMQFLLMGAGNDVANALARANGGTDRTVAQMNQRAKALGAFDTRAVTVTGLDADGQQTSVYDLALITRSDMRSKAFATMIATRSATVPGYGDYPEFQLANRNRMLFDYPGALGGIGGSTDTSGATFVGLAERGGRRLMVTMLGGDDAAQPLWQQAGALMDWVYALPEGTTPVGTLVANAAQATASRSALELPTARQRPTLVIGESPSTTTTPSAPAPVATAIAAAVGPTDPAAANTVTVSGKWTVLLWVGTALVGVLAVIAVGAGLRGSGPRPRPGPRQ